MGLTNREQQLIALIGRGTTNKEMLLTITHPDMKRFFMMIPEAVRPGAASLRYRARVSPAWRVDLTPA